ncbi:unnamed protein product, partial [Didymodactylos carnosus]
MYYNWSES